MFKTVNPEVVAKRRAILMAFMNDGWSKAAPKAIPPFDKTQKEVANKKNFEIFVTALHDHTVAGEGNKPITAEVLTEIVAALYEGTLPIKATDGTHYPRLERYPDVVAPTRKETLKAASDLTRQMNAKGLSPIQGFGTKEKEAQPPRASQAQIEAQARHDLNENSLMGDINSSIQQHRGKTHGDTDAQRKILLRIRDEGIDANTPNAEILKQIEAKRNEMLKWDAQQAIRIVYAPQFRERGIDLSQRTPSKYGDVQ